MKESIDLTNTRKITSRLDGKGYGAYKVLRNIIFEYNGVRAWFTRVQGDPYAPPSWLVVVLPRDFHGVETGEFPWKHAQPLTDTIHRILYREAKKKSWRCGTGNSCLITVPKPSPAILPRSSVEAGRGEIILRMSVGLPAIGRRIKGRLLEGLLSRIRGLIDVFHGLNRFRGMVKEEVLVWLDYMYIRRHLIENSYTAFIADDSILPRESSISTKPLQGAIPFKAPPSEEYVIDLPSGKKIKGLLITDKLTVITGGGYHGKTTLLKSIQEGIYPHIPGDGREYVATNPRTLMVQAEDGRLIHCVDIYGFIRNLPSGTDTHCFKTMNASGSTSMAASISEAVETGINTLLIDEDTSATNLLFKDKVMAKLLDYDPIKTLSEVIRDFMEKTGISIVLISSASSAFISKTRKVYVIKNYLPEKINIEPSEIEKLYHGIEKNYTPPRKRYFYEVKSLEKIKIHGYKMTYKYRDGKIYELNLDTNPRIVEHGQARYISVVIRWLNRRIRDGIPVQQIPELIDKTYKAKGFKAYTDPVPPDLTWAMGMDTVWVLNRLYNAVFKQ